MKKIFTLILAGLLAATLISCADENKQSGDDKQNDNKNENNVVETIKVADVYALTDALYASVPEGEKPFMMTEILGADMFEDFTFIPYEEGLEAVVSQPMIGSIPHSVVIVKTNSNEDAQRIAKAMEENCNPRKWVCVEADDVRSASNGNFAMLMMTQKALGMGDYIMEAFKAVDATDITAFEVPVIDDEMPENDDVQDDEANVVDENEDDGIEVSTGKVDIEEPKKEEPKVEELDKVDAPVSDPKAEEKVEAPVEAEVTQPEDNSAFEELKTAKAQEISELAFFMDTYTESANAVLEGIDYSSNNVIKAELETIESAIAEFASAAEAVMKAENEADLTLYFDMAQAANTKAQNALSFIEAEAANLKNAESVEAPAQDSADEVAALVESLYATIPDDRKPMLMTMPLDADMFEAQTFIPYEEGLQAVVSMPMMGSMAHKVVVVKCKDEADAKRVAAAMESNADPRWLVCVEADIVKSAVNGNFAMLMLTTTELEMGDTIYNNFVSYKG